MVKTHNRLPDISWGENMGPEDIRSVSDSIISAITTPLKLPASGYHRLFFVVPTPIPYERSEAELFSAFEANIKETGQLRSITLPPKGRCYVISDKECFRLLLPQLFKLGPPELTLLAANCTFEFSAEAAIIANFVLDAIKGEPPDDCDCTGLHFDSGDLIESF